ncbi:MAG: hypothetical protein WBD20_02525 [Pirellulaceae bacterium]
MKQIFKLQPAFTLELPQRSADVIEQIREAIKTPELEGLAESAGNCVDFKIDRSARRFWSPHLSVQVSETETGSQLFGRFSPRPEIWTMFMAIYAVMATMIFGSLIYAYVQWFMGMRPWALAIAPVGVLTILGLHLGSLIGQSLSTDQMGELRGRLDLALKQLK